MKFKKLYNYYLLYMLARIGNLIRLIFQIYLNFFFLLKIMSQYILKKILINFYNAHFFLFFILRKKYKLFDIFFVIVVLVSIFNNV